jgi:hypothetical protein
MPKQAKSTTAPTLPADELDKLQRQLLARAIAVIMSPDWGKPKARPAGDGSVMVTGSSST